MKILLSCTILFCLSFTSQASPELAKKVLAKKCALKDSWYPKFGYVHPELAEMGVTLDLPPKVIEAIRQWWGEYKMEIYALYKREMSESNYYVLKQKIQLVDPKKSQTENDKDTYSLLKMYHKPRYGREGWKVILCDNDKTLEIYYELRLRPGVRGASYTHHLTIEKSSGEVLFVKGQG